jgi:hypothetical protein
VHYLHFQLAELRRPDLRRGDRTPAFSGGMSQGDQRTFSQRPASVISPIREILSLPKYIDAQFYFHGTSGTPERRQVHDRIFGIANAGSNRDELMGGAASCQVKSV